MIIIRETISREIKTENGVRRLFALYADENQIERLA